MSNDRSSPDNDLSTTVPFEQWLERQATEEDISQEQLFERLVSSYWTLNEMEQLLGGSDAEPLSIDRPQSDGSGGDEEIHERLETLEELLEAEVERRQSLDPLVEALADRLTDVEGEIEELAAEVETVQSTLDEKHESVAERVDALEEDLEQEQDTRADEQQELAAEQSRISSRLDSEFENLETILTYLVSRTDELEAGVSDVDSKHEAALTRLRSERDALDSIKQEAADAGVRSGECESCGEAIDLGMLSRPYCPECETSLTGIEEEQKWLFFSDIVVTTDEGSQTRPAQTGDPQSRQDEHSRSATRERQSPGAPAHSGGNPGPGRDSEAFTGDVRDAEPDATESEPAPDRADSASGTPDPDDADDTGPTASRFEYPAVEEPSPDDGSGPHSQADTDPAWAPEDRSGTHAADEGDGHEEAEDDLDDTGSPFGDLSDLTTEE